MNYTLNYSFPYSAVLPPCNIKNMCALFLKIKKERLSPSVSIVTNILFMTQENVNHGLSQIGRKIYANKLYICISLTMGTFDQAWELLENKTQFSHSFVLLHHISNHVWCIHLWHFLYKWTKLQLNWRWPSVKIFYWWVIFEIVWSFLFS